MVLRFVAGQLGKWELVTGVARIDFPFVPLAAGGTVARQELALRIVFRAGFVFVGQQRVEPAMVVLRVATVQQADL